MRAMQSHHKLDFDIIETRIHKMSCNFGFDL